MNLFEGFEEGNENLNPIKRAFREKLKTISNDISSLIPGDPRQEKIKADLVIMMDTVKDQFKN
jgi:hypothetical protein